MTDYLARSLNEAHQQLIDRGIDLADISTIATRVQAGRTRSHRVEARRHQIETRAKDANTIEIAGYAATWDTWYPVAGGPPSGWMETIARGAVDKSIAEAADVRLLINHDGLALARVKDGDLELRADDIGLYFRATLDGNRSDARDLALAIESGNVDQCSWAFMVTRQQWNSDYTERTITEARMYDVSVVTYPANSATIVGVVDQPAQVASRIDRPASIEYRDVETDRFTPRQIAQYMADETLVEIHGQYLQDSSSEGAHYVAQSPFPGLVCSSCAFYDGARACEIVAGDIAPEGICKRWIIPNDLIPTDQPTLDAPADEIIASVGYPLRLAQAQAEALG